MANASSNPNKNKEPGVNRKRSDYIRQRPFDLESDIFESLLAVRPEVFDSEDLENEKFLRWVKNLIRKILELVFGDTEVAVMSLRATHAESFRDLESRFGVSRETIRRRTQDIQKTFDDL